MEIIDLQCNSGVKETYNNAGLSDFYSKYIDKNTLPAVHSHALKMATLWKYLLNK
jgi:hypothetical protein